MANMSEHDDNIPVPAPDESEADKTAGEPPNAVPESEEPAADDSGNDGGEESDKSGQDGVLNEFELNEMIEELCKSKADEFRMLGYEQVTGRDIWDCIADKYQKKGYPALHQIVNDILSLKTTQFMNWMTMSIYRNAQF